MDDAPRPTLRERCRQAWNKVGWFCVALLVASAYGLWALYVLQNAMLSCLIFTVIIAVVTGSIFVESMRVNVLLALAMLFSMEGKKVLLVLALTMVGHGPLNNTWGNFERATAGVLCGYELIWNQTQQQLQNSVTPLPSVQDKIKDISRNAHSLAGRVENLTNTLTDSVCHIFIIAALDRIRKELEFNMTTSVNSDVNLNSSQTWQKASQKAKEQLWRFRQHIVTIVYVLDYVGLFLLVFLFLEAFWYQKCYLQGYDFDNIYITKQFEEMDRDDLVDHVLPLRKREANIYIRTTSCRLLPCEVTAIWTGLQTMFYYTVASAALVFLDFKVFWAFDILYQMAEEEVVASAPVVIELQVNGSGYTSDIFKDPEAFFDFIQRRIIPVLNKKCLMKPVVPDYGGYIWIGCLYGLAFLLVPIGCYLKRLRSVICAHYYPQRETERIQHLRRRILSQRESEREIAFRVAVMAKEARFNIVQALPSFLPSAVKNYVTKRLGVNDKDCLACGEEIMDISSPNVHTCSNLQFPGHICSECFSRMGNSCPICTPPQVQDELFQ